MFNLNEQMVPMPKDKFVKYKGFHALVLAAAKDWNDFVYLLALAGRSTHVRAIWAAFHNNGEEVPWYKRLAGKEIYLSAADSRSVLQDGLEQVIIHRAIDPRHLKPEETGLVFDTSYHLACMLHKVIPFQDRHLPMLWEQGKDAGLIQRLDRCYGCELFLVSRSTSKWLALMKRKLALFQ